MNTDLLTGLMVDLLMAGLVWSLGGRRATAPCRPDAPVVELR
jgi:hypothetical protein